MSVDIITTMGTEEAYDDTSGELRSAKLSLDIKGTNDLATARAATLAAIAPSYAGLVLDKGSVVLKHRGYELFQCDVSYVHEEDQEKKDENEQDPEEWFQWGFSTRGATQKVTVAKDAVHFSNEPAPIHNTKAINVRATGRGWEVDGVDVIVPRLHLEFKKRFPKADIDTQLVRTLTEQTGSVNDAQFLGFDKGELLFEGCDKPVGSAEITYQFEASPNKVAMDVGGVVIDKEGHEYLWISFKTVDLANVLTQEVHTVHVSTVYDYTNFNNLELV